MFIIGILFYFLAAIIVLSALLVIIVKNPVHSILWLILSFFSAAGIFLLLGAEFVAMVTIIVYVGAIAVLFLFVVMMLNIDHVKLKENFHKYLPVSILVACVLAFDLYMVINSSFKDSNYNEILGNIESNLINSTTNTEAIGVVLYTKYILHFQLAGLILLVAMIGSIVLTLQTRKNVKKQVISKQLSRKREESVTLIDVEINKGVE